MGTPPSTDTATPPPVQLGSLMRRHHLSERLPEVLALTVGLLLSLAVAWAARQWDSEDRGERMREDVAVYAEAIGQQLQSLVAAVQALAQFYTASGAVGAEAFTLFTRPFLERNPAIQALEWVPWVSATRRDSFEAQVRAEGTADFAIREQVGAQLRPAGARPDYFPVWRVVPLTGNDQALGFNAGSEPRRRAALEQARDTGQAVATVPPTLVQGPADQRGILIFVPSTKAGSPAATLEERRRGLQGFAAGVMRLGAMVDGVVAALPPLGLDLVLRDANLPGAAGLLHVHSSRTRAFGMAPDTAALVPGADEQAVRLELAGQPLVLQALPAPGAYPRSAWPLVLMGFGFLISAALFALLRQRRQAAARLREREELFSHFMDRSPTVAWIKDAQGRWVYLSKTFEDRFGVRLGDHQGKTDADVWPPDLAARFLADDQRVLAEDRPLEIDETVPRADGQLRYWQTIKFPFRGADGRRFVGGIGMDVTARRQADEARHASEARYGSLFDNMLDGYAECRMLYTDGRPQDFIYLAVNPAFGRLTGLHDVVGRKVGELMPGIHESNPELLEIYGRVVLSGIPERFETRIEQAGWLAISVYRSGPEQFVATFDNITARKQAQVALYASEERLRLALDASRMGIYDWDTADNRIVWSPQHERLWGFASGEFDGTYDTFNSRIHPDDRSRVTAELTRCMAARVPYSSDFRVVWPDWSVHWVTSFGEFIFDAAGQSLRMIGVVMEITDRKLAEEKLRANAATLETALASMSDAVFISDTEGRLIHFNDAFVTFHKFRHKDDCLQTLAEYPVLLDVFSGDGELASPEQWVLPRALRGESATSVECRLRRKDTGETWVGSYSFAPIRNQNGVIFGAVVTARDITELKRAEVVLRRYQQIVETTEEILLFIDCDRCLQMVNPAFAALYLDTPEVLQGRPLRAVVGEEVYARIAPQLDAALAGERGQFSLQNTFADGRHRYLEVTYSPFWVAAEVQGVVVSVHDITAAEEARAALEAQQTHLEAALREARLARLDALTGIANRAGFDDRLEQVFAQSRRYDRRFGLVLLDLDDFKVINDTRGHQAGDVVLKDVAASLIQSCRAGDLAGRYGGDEFAILLSELPDSAAVVEIARRFSDALAALNWNGRSISASVGIAIYPDHAGDIPELIRLADRAMYASKAAGKNHVTLASALPPDLPPADGPDSGG
ncbi:PAS domain S-box protein [uncultured Lamprocystis sp.]|uniref:PAS domain S-box protein n=1 Tax=uncultured Lamprocystis sp. TaxID=543132 RepID=UPI0025F2A2E6|nr:PAS domain S-box protein [uncultured Lamprocystis sp.]